MYRDSATWRCDHSISNWRVSSQNGLYPFWSIFYIWDLSCWNIKKIIRNFVIPLYCLLLACILFVIFILYYTIVPLLKTSKYGAWYNPFCEWKISLMGAHVHKMMYHNVKSPVTFFFFLGGGGGGGSHQLLLDNCIKLNRNHAVPVNSPIEKCTYNADVFDDRTAIIWGFKHAKLNWF